MSTLFTWGVNRMCVNIFTFHEYSSKLSSDVHLSFPVTQINLLCVCLFTASLSKEQMKEPLKETCLLLARTKRKTFLWYITVVAHLQPAAFLSFVTWAWDRRPPDRLTLLHDLAHVVRTVVLLSSRCDKAHASCYNPNSCARVLHVVLVRHL